MKWEIEPMAGIVSYGAYIPRYRINRKVIHKAMGWLNPTAYLSGEKAVANYDEDSLTMAVEASRYCLKGIDSSKVDAVFFASTTAPYAERQNAEILATALDCRTDIRTADFAGSLKAATTSMLSAIDTVKAGSAKSIIVAAGDCRLGKAASSQEELWGDAAASIMIGQENVIARFLGSYSVSFDFVDHWRNANDRFDRQWEDRFIREEGYSKFIVEALQGLEKECSISLSEVNKVTYPCLYPGDFKNIAQNVELSPDQVEEPLLNSVGFAGAADPLMHLIKVLETAKPGDRIAVIAYGSGAEAILFEVSNGIQEIQRNRQGVRKHLERRHELSSYEKMIAFKNLLPLEKGIRGEMVLPTAISELWRSRREVLGLCGSLCRQCGTPQFPAQRICVNPRCGAVGQMESYRFSDKEGTLFTYTGDNLAFSLNPPAMYGIVEFNRGGRYWFDITDAELEELEVGMPVEMSFRRKYMDEKNGISGYFWKAIPKAHVKPGRPSESSGPHM
jgi:3-hydroxy-3-methylglutaryl CoA synthase